MSDSLFSPSWYRVQSLRPRLRAHAMIHRHQYRGKLWYVLQDPSKDQFHRLTPGTHYVVGLMDGRRSVEEIWLAAADELGDEAPTQDEMIQLLGQLHASDLLRSEVPPDAAEILERAEKQQQQKSRSRWLSPFSIRVPLFDPEQFLAATTPLVRPFIGVVGVLLWLAVVVPAVFLAGVHWDELTNDALARILTAEGIVMIAAVFPFLKLLHELGHGYAAKAYGGEVHDMGIMFLIFAPVPYVDASSSWAFRSKYRRAFVGAAGMIVEVFVASLALFVWLAAEPGIVRAIAYNTVLIGGVTTLLFNANPLLRFDGYYILSDLIEIPNLRSRANGFIGYLTQRHVLGDREVQRPEAVRGEPTWFVTYGVAAFINRAFITLAISYWLMDQFLIIGIALGAFAAFGWFVVPLWKLARKLFAEPGMRRLRTRALTTLAASLVAVAVLLTLVPMPFRSSAEGVVWLAEEAFVRSRTDGFITSIVARPGSLVSEGQLLIKTSDPELETEARKLAGRVDELSAQWNAQRDVDIVEAQLIAEELSFTRRRLERIRDRVADLEVRSKVAGRFVVSNSEDLPGRFVRKGQLLGHVVDLSRLRVRAIVGQDDADLVRQRTEAIEVRLAEQLGTVLAANIARVVPAASQQLPSAALGLEGGGRAAVDPRDQRGERALARYFEIELEVPTEEQPVSAGGRVYIRFDHGNSPLASQIYLRVRQVFLEQLHV